MRETNLLLSIRPQYADKILNGMKTVELRRVFPRIARVSTVLVYITSPVKSLAGIIRVDRVIAQPPHTLWGIVGDQAGITLSEFEAYYAGASLGYGIFFKEVLRLPELIHLDKLRRKWVGFQPPQGYCYLADDQLNWVYESAGTCRQSFANFGESSRVRLATANLDDCYGAVLPIPDL